MAFLRFSVSAVSVLHAAILFTTFVSLYSEWSFLRMVNCQGGSSYLVDTNAVVYSIPSDRDINKCCKECQNDKGGCVPNCDKCDVLLGASFMKKLFKYILGNATWGRFGLLRNYQNVNQPYYRNWLATFLGYPRDDQNCVDGENGCKPTAVCANAGQGAYSSFCQKECVQDQMMGFASMTMSFLPDRACRAYCAKYVQQMCARNQCSDYGCVVYDCASRAVSICG